MRYFDFDQINPITRFLNNSSWEAQKYSHEHWFNFDAVHDKALWSEEIVMFVAVSVLIYSWYKLFAIYDR